MTFVLIFLAVGLCLLGLLLFLFLRMKAQPQDKTDAAVATALLAADAALWSQRLGDRIFSQVDLEFILKEAPSLRQQLVRERRGIALLWIAQRKDAARAVIHFHRLVARANIALSPVVEFKLAANYFVFLATCALAECLVWLRGPFASRKVVSSLIAVGDRMRSLSEALLGGLDPVLLEEIRNRRAGQSQASQQERRGA